MKGGEKTMRRKASTALTRGRISRVISRTTAVIRCYEKASGEVVDLSVEFDCKVPHERVISRAIKDGYINTDNYTALDIISVEDSGALYAMDINTFIEHAELIEDGLSD